MTSQMLMSPEEKWERYSRIRREAGSELAAYQHALATDDDVYDRFELAFLWRSVCEGQTVSDATWEQMVEATNP